MSRPLRSRPADPTPARRPWIAWTGLAWMAVVVLLFAASYRYAPRAFLHLLGVSGILPSLPVLLYDLKGLLLLAGLLLGACAAGSTLLKKVPWSGALEELVFSTTLGLGLLAYLILGLGAASLYRPLVFQGLWGALALGGLLWALCRGRSVIGGSLAQVRSASPALRGLWLKGPLLLLFATSFLMALVPEIFYDALVYHLGVPRMYLQAGRLTEIPNLHAKFPFTFQMLYLFGMGLAEDLLPKLLHWSCGLLLALLFLSQGIRHGRPRAGWIAGALALSMPMTQMNWWTSGMDVGLSLFAVASAFAVANALALSGGAAWLVLAGLLAGLAAGSKYTAVVWVGGILLAWVTGLPSRERPFFDRLKGLVWLGGLSALLLAPWLLKNLLQTGNPVFPFLGDLFGAPGLAPQAMETFTGQNRGLTPETLRGWLALPWNLTFGNDWAALSFPGPLPLALLPAPFLIPRESRPPGWRPIALSVLFSLAVLLAVNRLLRYSLPALAAGSWLLAWAAAHLFESGGPVFRRVFALLFSGAVLWNTLVGWGMIQGAYNPLEVLTGRESRRAYVSYTHPGMSPAPSTALFDFAESALPPGSRMLIVGDEKVAHCRAPFLASGVFDLSPLVLWSRESPNPEALGERFRAEGITHLLVNLSEARRTYGYRYLSWDDDSLVRFARFWNAQVRLLREESVAEKLFPEAAIHLALFELRPREEARLEPPPPNPLLWLEREEIRKKSGDKAALEFTSRIEDRLRRP